MKTLQNEQADGREVRFEKYSQSAAECLYGLMVSQAGCEQRIPTAVMSVVGLADCEFESLCGIPNGRQVGERVPTPGRGMVFAVSSYGLCALQWRVPQARPVDRLRSVQR